jgi:mono/diheme cytochrome c family protein
MKKFFKIIGILILLIVIVIGGFASFIAIRGIPKYEANVPAVAKVEITPARVARGEKIASMLCQNCHMNQETHQMTGRYLSEIPEFGMINSKNITNDPEVGIGKWTDADLIYFIRTGIHPHTGQYVPIYMPKLVHISDEDMRSIVAYLRSDKPEVQASKTELPEAQPSFLTKFLCMVAFKPFEYPKAPIPNPDTTNQLEWGKYLTLYQLECYACHSKSFEKLNMLEPEKSEGFLGGGNPITGPDGNKINSLNLTPDEETGIGKWSEDVFINAVRNGVVPNGSALRQPMMPFVYLTDAELKAMYAYLRTVPKLSNKVDRGI